MSGNFYGRSSPGELADESATAQWQRGRSPPQRPPPNRGDEDKLNIPYIPFCGHSVPLDQLGHILAMGQSGGGKSLLLSPTIYGIARAVTEDPTRKLLIVATKDENAKGIKGLRVPHVLVTFTYSQGLGWHIEHDFRSPFQIGQLSNDFFKEFEGDNAFWNRVGRSIHTAICVSLKERKGGCSLGDQIRAIYLSNEELRHLLNSSQYGRRIVEVFLSNQDAEMLGKFRSQVASGIERYLIAACKSELSYPFSLEEFYFGDSLPPIAIIQLNPDMQEVERPLASSLIRRAFELILLGSTTSRKDKIVVIEDINHMKAIPKLVEMSELSRAQGCVLIALSQSFEGLQSKDSYGDQAEALLNNFPFQVFLGTNSAKTAKWCAERFGESEHFEDNYGRSFGKDNIQGREERRRSVESIVKSAEILNLPPPSPKNGFHFYLKTPLCGYELRKYIPWHQVLKRTPQMREVTLTPIPEAFQQLKFWTPEEVKRLLAGKPSQVNPDYTDPNAFAENLRLFEEEIMQCLYDLLQLGDPDMIRHFSQFSPVHTKE